MPATQNTSPFSLSHCCTLALSLSRLTHTTHRHPPFMLAGRRRWHHACWSSGSSLRVRGGRLSASAREEATT